MATVFVTQDTNHNLTPAQKYGEIEIVNGRDFPVFKENNQPFVSEIRRKLANFKPAEDYLLLIGDPINIGLCMMVVAERFPFIRVLKWDGQTRSYIPILVPFRLEE